MRVMGYFVPEFPAQTHAFFWREIQELENRQVRPLLISTRPAPSALASHSWSKEAFERTHYVLPESRTKWLSAGWTAALKHRRRFARILGMISQADCSNRERAKLLGAAIAGSRLADLLSERGCRHVHVHSAALSADIALFASILSDVTFSLTLHGPLEDYGCNQINKWSGASFGIVITEKLKKELLARLPVDEREIVVAPMGVDLDKFRRSIDYQPHSGDRPFRLFSCGRLNTAKGHQELIRAIAAVRERGMDAMLTIAGEDEQGGAGYRVELQALIEALDLGANVKLLGAISEEEIVKHLEQADCFCLASHGEPLGVAIMEAMAMGVPTIATDGGGVRELMSSEDQAVLVPPKDVGRLAEAIVDISQRSEYSTLLSIEGQRRARAAFGSARSAQTLLAKLQAHGALEQR